ncbi:NRDE family protein [Alkalicoccus daliensis]|uniref:Uncharacterized conserved protein, contains NRDE domain n=1 Tax=Alkalicoccus daliensis TaxID=745820 RepID=A0A1H0AQ79_9BACI|nr:NRDE family protein [Alkalicoccus daliensis]SDN35670.1 Uncharacterized conserved protein, contains NRDE domain [Alkalicoccus daliensis]
MCIIGTALQVHESFPFILAANRDEFIQRPASSAHWWNGNFVAGKDLSQGGTWLGLAQDGKIGALTNVRAPEEDGLAEYSRGMLIPLWLKEGEITSLLEKKFKFGGFNMFYGTIKDLYYVSNKTNKFIKLETGIHTISNADLSTEWPKTAQLKKDFESFMDLPKNQLIEALFSALYKKEKWPDKVLPDTGVGLELERSLSPAFIEMEDYGTRCSTVILVNNDGVATFIERSFRPQEKEVCYQFQLQIKPDK